MTARQSWLTAQEVAEIFECSPDHVIKKVKNGEWPGRKLGNRMYRLTPEDVAQIEELTKVKPRDQTGQNSPLSKASQRRLAAKRLRRPQASP